MQLGANKIKCARKLQKTVHRSWSGLVANLVSADILRLKPLDYCALNLSDDLPKWIQIILLFDGFFLDSNHESEKVCKGKKD